MTHPRMISALLGATALALTFAAPAQSQTGQQTETEITEANACDALQQMIEEAGDKVSPDFADAQDVATMSDGNACMLYVQQVEEVGGITALTPTGEDAAGQAGSQGQPAVQAQADGTDGPDMQQDAQSGGGQSDTAQSTTTGQAGAEQDSAQSTTTGQDGAQQDTAQTTTTDQAGTEQDTAETTTTGQAGTEQDSTQATTTDQAGTEQDTAQATTTDEPAAQDDAGEQATTDQGGTEAVGDEAATEVTPEASTETTTEAATEATSEEAASAGAAETGTTQQEVEVEVETGTEVIVADIIDREVVTAAGEEIGEIDRIVTIGNEPHVIFERGGFFGIGSDDVAVPASQITMQGEDLVLTGVGAEEFEAMPAFEAEAETALADEDTVRIGSAE